MATISRRGGRIGVDYRDEFGKRRWVTCATEEEAKRTLASIQSTRKTRRNPHVPSDILVAEYAKTWLERQASRVKPSTHENYDRVLRLHVLPQLGLMRLRDLGRPLLKDWAAKLGRESAAKSVTLCVAVLRAMLQSAVEDEIFAANPASGLVRAVLPREKRNSATLEAMSGEQLSRFLSAVRAVDPEAYEPFLLLATTGVRISELAGLQWRDVDWEHRQLRIERALNRDGKTATPKTEQGRRRIDLSVGVLEALRELRVRHERRQLTWGKPEAWIMWPELTSKVDPLTLRSKIERLRAVELRALRREGMPEHFGLHSMRHTYCSLLLQRGWSPAYVQRQAGHSSIQVTVDTYGRWLPLGNLEAADDLWSLVGGTAAAARTKLQRAK
jgi:integrase